MDGKLVIHQKNGFLELDGLLLQSGNIVEITILGSWIKGNIAHDERGWYFVTPHNVAVRLQTGLTARLISLSASSF